MKSRKPFFESVKNPGLIMNKYGVVLAPKSHPEAWTDLWHVDCLANCSYPAEKRQID